MLHKERFILFCQKKVSASTFLIFNQKINKKIFKNKNAKKNTEKT